MGETELHLVIDPSSAVPIFAQIKDQVKHAVASGRLRAGDPVASVRALATALRVNRNTVAKAYSQLEQERVIETRVGEGSFVASRTAWLTTRERRRRIENRADALVTEAYLLSFRLEELGSFVDERTRRLELSRAEKSKRGKSKGKKR